MTLTKQKNLLQPDLAPYFSNIYQTRCYRNGLSPNYDTWYCAPVGAWHLEGWIDGPLTFIVMEDNAGVHFTGWSKFDNEGQWSEQNGICRALQKAIEKYIAYQFEAIQKELEDSKWGHGVVEIPVTPEEAFHEIQADGDPVATDQDRQAS